jgi:hypothetical protein
MDDFVSNAMQGLLIRVPYLVVCLAGAVLVGMRWSRDPRAALLALLGLAVLFLSSIGTTFAFQLVGMWLSRGTVPFDRAEWFYNGTSFFFYLLDAIGVGFLVAALVYRSRR